MKQYLKESALFALCMLTLPLIATMGLVLGIWLFRVHLVDFLQNTTQIFGYSGLEKLKHMPLWRVPLCGLEDVIFVWPSLLLLKHNYMKIMVPVLVFSSMVFMTGHFYQGFASGVIKVIYPTFALYYANKHGISRTITGHIMVDTVAILLMQSFAI